MSIQNKTYLGVAVCRLQTPSLHDGHIKLLEHIWHNSERTLIILGDRDSPASHVNPLSFAVRKAMLERYYPNILIARIWDHPNSEVWSKNLDAIITAFSCGLTAQLYTGRDGFSKHYTGRYPVEETFFGCDGITATDARQRTTSTEYYQDSTWRAGYIAAYEEMTPRTFETVDMLIWNNNGEILLGKRSWSDTYRFLGGFVESGETFETAARRETREESNVWVENFRIVKDFIINDWRLRGNTKDKHRTVLMAGSVSWQAPQAGDDMAEVHWVAPQTILDNPELIIPNHQAMFFEGAVPILATENVIFSS
jgi:bifunctional NMN adenylyltransferase/nudix hydrolase